MFNKENQNYETIGHKFKGEVVDRLIDAKSGRVLDERIYNNLVVDSCSILIAALMKGDTPGASYFALGSGDSSWEDTALPEPEDTDTKLLNEVFRKAIDTNNISFIDNDNNIVSKQTNRIQISVVFNESEANGELRELGVFGGSSATSAKDSGLMINRKIHGLIYKTSAMRLERIIRFSF